MSDIHSRSNKEGIPGRSWAWHVPDCPRVARSPSLSLGRELAKPSSWALRCLPVVHRRTRPGRVNHSQDPDARAQMGAGGARAAQGCWRGSVVLPQICAAGGGCACEDSPHVVEHVDELGRGWGARCVWVLAEREGVRHAVASGSGSGVLHRSERAKGGRADAR